MNKKLFSVLLLASAMGYSQVVWQPTTVTTSTGNIAREGNVAIGTATANATYKFSVTGSSLFTGNTNFMGNLGIGIAPATTVGLYLKSSANTFASYSQLNINSTNPDTAPLFDLRNNGNLGIGIKAHENVKLYSKSLASDFLTHSQLNLNSTNPDTAPLFDLRNNGMIGLGKIAIDGYRIDAADGLIRFQNLSGTGTRMVVADSFGKLSTQNIPTVTGESTTVLDTPTIDLTLAGAQIKADVINNSITTDKILDGTIVTADIANNAVTTDKILDGTIATADIKDGAVTSAKIFDATIALNDLSATGTRSATTFLAGDNTWKPISSSGTATITSNALSLSGTNLTSTVNGVSSTAINLSSINTDNQTLSLNSNNILAISGSASTVNLAPYLDNTDNQQLSISGSTLSLTNGGSVTLPTVASPQGETGATGLQGPAGANGVGITSTVNNSNGTYTFNYSNGTSFTTSNLTGPQGLQGVAGADGTNGVGITSTDNNGNGTYTFNYSNGTSFTTSNLTGPQGPIGLTGATGLKGPAGTNGVGVPTGGTTNQVLAKNSNNDYDTKWITLPTSSTGGSTVIQNGNGTTVEGSGSTTDPYKINVVNATGSNLNTVYTIGSNLSINGTSSVIATNPTPGIIRNSANIVVSDLSSTNINSIVANAYNNGYRKIYFQEGVYFVNETIDLNGKGDLTIEGAGKGTIFKPTTSFDLTSKIFNIENCERVVLKSFTIDLKRSVSNAQATDDVDTGIRISGGGQNNTFDNLFFGSVLSSNSTVTSVSPILIDLKRSTKKILDENENPILDNAGNFTYYGEEADYNHFNNIRFNRSRGGIVLNVRENGVFNSNIFSNIHLHYPEIGVNFIGTDGIIEGNIFSIFDVQASKDTDGLRLRTTNIVRNIRGAANTFRDFTIADFNPNAAATSTDYVFNTISSATRTVIENSEVEGVTNHGRSDKRNGYYQDLGVGTQFLNNANGERETDYIAKGVNDFYVEGTQRSTYPEAINTVERNHLAFKNFGKVLLRNDENNWNNSNFSVYNYGKIRLGNKYVSPKEDDTYNGDSNLEVYGSVNFTTRSQNIYINAFGRMGIWGNPISNAALATYGNLLFKGSGNSDILSVDYANGNVVIGTNGLTNTANNTSYKLLVNGKVLVKDEILVQSTGLTWADYVFTPSYNLKPLREVETFIKENGHLPNIPSAKEIETNGLPLAKISTLQQEKIEELTLYVIEQNKKIEAQNKQIEELSTMKQEMEALKTMVEQLKK